MSDQSRVYLSDTATFEATIYADDGVSTLPASTVAWSIKKPDGTIDVQAPQPITQTSVVVGYNGTSLPGQYKAQVQFTLTDGSKRSATLSFHVTDPLEVTGESTNDIDKTVDRAWMKLEDAFDSDLGGPYLADVTKAIFDREKMERLLPDALYVINNIYQPATTYTEATFPFAAHYPLLSQSLLVQSIRHLMRSYVEQPLPVGQNVNYLDRRDYLNRWQTILGLEQQTLDAWLDLFKRDQMGFGTSSVLVGGYASWPTRYPRYMRGKYPYVYRW
jgi:hypothetical protein